MEPIDKFNFLDAHTAKEPFVLDVLAEIDIQQSQALPAGSHSLATLDSLKKSRNIKIPFSASRDKTIEYLLEMLVTRFPERLKPVITFDFRVEEGTKRLSIVESMEFTISINAKDYQDLCAIRDATSVENLMVLLRRFRFFNLTKLIKIARNKTDLARVIKIEENRQIFIFRNYSLDRNKLEMTEDYCFHSQNYAAVRDSLNLGNLKDIISRYNDLISRRLKNFGILNAYISDYQDAKMDYILNILVNDMPTILASPDLIAAKNLQSLRKCLLGVEDQMDPLQTLGGDIKRCIADNQMCTSTDLVATVLNLTHDLLEKWTTPENLQAHKILTYLDEQGVVYFIDSTRFIKIISDLNNLIVLHPEKMSAMSYSERQTTVQNMDVLCNTARNILSSPDKIKEFQFGEKEVQDLKRILEEQKEYRETIQARQSSLRYPAEMKARRSIFGTIIDFFRRLFSRKPSVRTGAREIPAASARPISQETRQITKKLSARTAPLHVLSDLIPLTPENDSQIDTLINEMREFNLRIVIPVYNAKEVLYPVRSQKILMEDIDYILVLPDVARNPDTIRKYTDSLVGFKIKDEIISSKAIVLVEKYLLAQYRQKRAQMLKKEL